MAFRARLESEYLRCDHVPPGAAHCERHGLTEATEMGECARCVKPRTPAGAERVTDDPAADETYQCRCDWRSWSDAGAAAALATRLTGELHVPTDTPSCSPQFGVVRAPAVGDKVSYAFNGDSYPDGVIVRVTPSLRVVTDTGSKYFRRRHTGAWLKTGGTWSLVRGHESTRNPHF